MNQAVTLRVRTGETETGDIGETTPTFDETTTTMYLEPRTSNEQQADRNTPITDWLGMGPADIVFTAWDQVVYGAHTFDIIGDPRPMWNPRTGEVSHWEMSLQEVDG
jgi:hypothetical protein